MLRYLKLVRRGAIFHYNETRNKIEWDVKTSSKIEIEDWE